MGKLILIVGTLIVWAIMPPMGMMMWAIIIGYSFLSWRTDLAIERAEQARIEANMLDKFGPNWREHLR